MSTTPDSGLTTTQIAEQTRTMDLLLGRDPVSSG